MATRTRNKTASASKETQEAINKLADELEKVDKLNETIETATEEIDELRWEAAENARTIVRDFKVGAPTLATEVAKTPAYIRQLVSVAELYGEPDYRLSERSFNDHLELAKLKAEDRDEVAKYASEFGCSIKVARIKVKAKKADKVAKAEGGSSPASSGKSSSSSSSSSSSPSRPKLRGGGVEQANEDLRALIKHLGPVAADIATAIKQGARLNAKEAKELTGVAESLAASAGAATAEAPATDQAKPKGKARRVVRNKG